jgi:hypothetical protein
MILTNKTKQKFKESVQMNERNYLLSKVEELQQSLGIFKKLAENEDTELLNMNDVLRNIDMLTESVDNVIEEYEVNEEIE